MKSGTLNWYIAPTYKSAKQIAWRQLKAMVPKELFAAKNEVELSIELVNGSRIELKGGESADNLRGASLSNVVLDEAAYIPQDAWEMVIRPALADQRGSAFFISTPAGYNHFHEMWEQAADLDDWQTFSYSTIEGGNVPPEEVSRPCRTLDERTFKQEFLASSRRSVGACSPSSMTPTLMTRSRTWRPVLQVWISTSGDGWRHLSKVGHAASVGRDRRQELEHR